MAEGGAVLCCRGPGAAEATPGERYRALPRPLWGGCPRAGGGAGALGLLPVLRAEADERLRRRLRSVFGVASRERCDTAGMTRLLTALVHVALSSTETDGAVITSKHIDGKENGKPKKHACCILLIAQVRSATSAPSTPTLSTLK